MRELYKIRIVLWTVLIGLGATAGYGQCNPVYEYSVTHATANQRNGSIQIQFSSTAPVPTCYLVEAAGSVPQILLEADRQVHQATGTVTFQNLAPGAYQVRVAPRGCKYFIIGEKTALAVRTRD